MSTSALVESLQRIKTDLDVECTCHLHHGANCPKRIAAVTLAKHEENPEPIPAEDIGFRTRTMHQNEALVLMAAQSLFGKTEMAGTWGEIENGIREALLADARFVLKTIDDFAPGEAR